MGEILSIILWGTILWSICFLAIQKIILPDFSFGFCSRIVSTIHAIIAVILAALSVQQWSCPVCPVASHSSQDQMQVIGVSMSYLLYDLICSCFDEQVGVDNALHHIVSIVGFASGLAYQRCGSEMVAAIFLTEISSPVLHLRYFLKELGYHETDLNFAADMSFAVIFSLARMIGGPYLTYQVLRATNPFIIKAMAMGLQLVSAFWFYKILRMANHKLKRRSTKFPSTIKIL